MTFDQKIDQNNADDATKLFSVPDFVGDLCKAVASRVRGAVAAVQFDDFHKNSAKIIRSSVFGIDTTSGKVRDRFGFPANNLVITSIDIQVCSTNMWRRKLTFMQFSRPSPWTSAHATHFRSPCSWPSRLRPTRRRPQPATRPSVCSLIHFTVSI